LTNCGTQYYTHAEQGTEIPIEFVATHSFEASAKRLLTEEDRRARIYLLLVYSKAAKDDLTQAEENELRKLAKALEGDSE
jgi:hypothetical protein